MIFDKIQYSSKDLNRIWPYLPVYKRIKPIEFRGIQINFKECKVNWWNWMGFNGVRLNLI